MPELPEVQTVVDGLRKTIIGKEIIQCEVIRSSIIQGNDEQFVKEVQNTVFQSIDRRGKYILLTLSSGKSIVTHLRMTGKFIYVKSANEKSKYERVIFRLKNSFNLVFHDVRCFGTIELVDNLQKSEKLKKIGWEPWDKRLTAETLQRELKKRSIPIKSALLDQSIIAGIGNIYASEILFDCQINPKRRCKSLNKKHLKKILESTRKILSLAMEHNGTSISDYRRVDDKTGEFQNFLKVYGKKDKPCVRCRNPIKKEIISQRSTFLCSKCQK